MSVVALDPYDKDIENYVCSVIGYDYNDNDDDGYYEVYKNSHDHEPYEYESYYFGGEYEKK